MEIFLEIDDPFAARVEANRLKEAVFTTVQLAGFSAKSLTVSVTDADTVQQLNRQYRHIDAPTDVLSFENTPDPDFPETITAAVAGHLGDIVIAYPMAEKQAQSGGHPIMAEITLLAVHGTLHLLGFDHDTAGSKAKMWSLQQTVMQQLGLPHVQPTET